MATRQGFGEALAALGRRDGRIVALDGEVGNSTYTEMFAEAHPERYFEMYIAEQQLVAAAVGMQVRGWVPFASTFAAFFSRAYDFIRMAAISRADIRLVGSHCGVSIGEDGPSQMGTRGHRHAAGGARQHRPLPVLRQPDREARRGDGRPARRLLPADDARRDAGRCTPRTSSSRSAARGSLRSSESDEVTLVAAGITLHEALAAAEELARRGSRSASSTSTR